MFAGSEFRGFAPIGILECWKIGMVGKKVFYQFKKGSIPLLLTNIPRFHHSIIPYCTGKPVAITSNVISIGCRNSEALIYPVRDMIRMEIAL